MAIGVKDDHRAKGVWGVSQSDDIRQARPCYWHFAGMRQSDGLNRETVPVLFRLEFCPRQRPEGRCGIDTIQQERDPDKVKKASPLTNEMTARAPFLFLPEAALVRYNGRGSKANGGISVSARRDAPVWALAEGSIRI